MATVAERTYLSRFAEQRFWLRPPRMAHHPTTGEVLSSDVGHPIEFHDGKFTTSNPEEIAYLDRLLGPELAVLDPGELSGSLGPEVTQGVSTATTVERAETRCRECGRAFANTAQLKIHARSHTAARRRAAEAAAGPE